MALNRHPIADGFDVHPSNVWLLAPVAIATAHLGQGIGQAMIRSALESIQNEYGAEIVLKVDTTVENIRLVREDDHDVDRKAEVNPMRLKSESLKR